MFPPCSVISEDLSPSSVIPQTDNCGSVGVGESSLEIEAHSWVNTQEAYLHPEDAPESKANMLTQFPRIVCATFLLSESVVVHSHPRLSSFLIK